MNTISFAHTLDKVLWGEKTQTRRLFKKEWEVSESYRAKLDPSRYDGVLSMLELQIDSIFTTKLKGAQDVYTDVFKIGGVHTVVGGRGKPAVMVADKKLQIRVTRIRVEDVRLITPEDVKAEGFTSYAEFMETWCGMHDKPAHKAIAQMRTNLQMIAVGRPNYIEDKTWALLKERPDNRYQAVVLDFEVVK